MLVTIEKASIIHLDTLYEIEIKCFETEAFAKQQIAYLLADSDSVSLISKLKDDITGFVIGKTYINEQSATGHIVTIDVLPDHRRKEIGQRLLQAIEKTFRDKGVEVCFLEVQQNNIAALNLYQKFGYRIVGALKNYYGAANGIRLKKVLT